MKIIVTSPLYPSMKLVPLIKIEEIAINKNIKKITENIKREVII